MQQEMDSVAGTGTTTERPLAGEACQAAADWGGLPPKLAQYPIAVGDVHSLPARHWVLTPVQVKVRWVEQVEHADMAEEDKWLIFNLLLHGDGRVEEVPGRMPLAQRSMTAPSSATRAPAALTSSR
jgi:hypothetical protein